MIRYASAVVLLTVLFAAATAAQTVVPEHTLRPGHMVTAEDIRISEQPLNGTYSNVSQVIGQEVQRVLYRGRPLQVGDVGPRALVHRNDIVTLVYKTGTLNIATEGRALGRGAVGDTLRVLNLVSKNTVLGHVSDLAEVTVSGK
ncbi:flagellar basal body P-ring formation chaperone FlgA [Litoreibacter albidus]|uniref:flagellar basal body P-ring formation chaperone FlgA n=1 Tax=Litoreibacter albidus TaxID=670155 RepID=UPI0037364532